MGAALLAGCQTPRPLNVSLTELPPGPNRGQPPVRVALADGWTFTGEFILDPATRMPRSVVQDYFRGTAAELTAVAAEAALRADLEPGTHRVSFAVEVSRRGRVTAVELESDPRGTELPRRIAKSLRARSPLPRWTPQMLAAQNRSLLIQAEFTYIKPGPPPAPSPTP